MAYPLMFDAATVRDRATYSDSMQFSAGIEHVLVGGVFVVRGGAVVDGVAPGKPILGRSSDER